MVTKSCTKILNFSTRFSCQHFAVEDFVTLPMGKNLGDGEMLCLSMVSTNLFRLFYAGEIQNLNCRRLGMATYSGVFFFYTWVRFAREGKAVALQYHEQGSTDTNVCGGFAVVRALSVDEHKHSPARIR